MAEKRTKTRKKIKLNKKLVCIIGILLFLVAVIFVNIMIFKPVNVGKINKEGKAEYIDTLAIGQHTLKVAFTDGGEAKTTFTIARQFEENNNNENVSLNAENKKEMKDDGSNPKTGDNVMLYIAIVSMSIIGLGATTVAVKKNKTN